jgi:hypothetical protein
MITILGKKRTQKNTGKEGEVYSLKVIKMTV